MKKKSILISSLAAVVIAAGSGLGYQQFTSAQQKPVESKKLSTKATSNTGAIQQTAEQNPEDKNKDQNQNNQDTQTEAQDQGQSESAASNDNGSDAQSASTTTTATTTAAPAQTTTQTTTRTDGFNFAGKHFDVTPFTNTTGGNTPRWTPYIFQWSALPNYYLAEAASSAGYAVRQLSYGSEAVINGQTYHVTEIRTGMKRTDSMGTVQALSNSHALGIQTCDDASGTYVSTYWFD
ncbi:hypothetical protein LQZ24_02965 [Fructobacillus sp. M1-13]|uniref:Uncharacterized protein n=1 Tax=Fructobacillus papyriferae TaxID=2713171 RepID=A0ABS5QSQ1_9LACO|nr:hypothetical protein [Fructobacillus papyriferae]MBS9335339.1 hypothetical protein [Fructobacillus papyriferae]MCD2158992.1 hypothetical protein [Fructobacillus papyriferae]